MARREASQRDDAAERLSVIDHPVERLLLSGAARTVHEADEMYLDSDAAYGEVLALVASGLSDEELGRLLLLYHSQCSRPRGLAAVISDVRVAQVVAEVESVAITCLVMGGDPVRFYGLARTKRTQRR